uniref:Uncharacterized protein n=1 Tax=Leersia perrieri TaxID=77586 RepID=A0A0D9XDU3_9ORYZ
MQDTEMKRRRLESINQRKLSLLAEVKLWVSDRLDLFLITIAYLYLQNDEIADCQGHEDRLPSERFDQAGIDEDNIAADVNLLAFRDTGNSPVSDDKRSVSWQDRVALKV